MAPVTVDGWAEGEAGVRNGHEGEDDDDDESRLVVDAGYGGMLLLHFKL